MTRLPSSPPSYYLLLLSIALFSLLLFNYLSLRNEHHNLAMRLVLDGPCTQDCEEDPFLVEHIRKTALVQPSGRMPILKNPGSVNQKGQKGQVNWILKHYDNKGSFLNDFKQTEALFLLNFLHPYIDSLRKP